MKISELILELEKIKEKEGDLVVYIYPYFNTHAVSDIENKVVKIVGPKGEEKSLLIKGNN